MILKVALEVTKSINAIRQDLRELIKNKGLSDPEVIRMNQQLDREIITLKKLVTKSIL